MKLIYKKLPSNRLKDCILTIGVFDGIHLGHQYILKKIKSKAAEKGKPALVISFDIPPEKVLCPPNKFSGYITDHKQKASLISSLNIDYLWLLRTKMSLLRLSADSFLSYISKYFLINEMVVGSDFRFGVRAKAGIKELKQISNDYGFNLQVIDKKRFHGSLVSSSFLKRLIRSSQFGKVKKFLGRKYTLKGRVERGKGIGKQLGFPTANLNTFDYILPSPGVYAAWSRVGKKSLLSAVNIGKNDFEVHLIDFSKNILDNIIEVTFLEKIRNESDFRSQAQLAKQIQKDIQTIISKYSIPAG